jgi:acetyl esterase/lipase
MSAGDRIDPDARVPLDQLLEALPGGFNAIPDIVDRRAAVTALLASLEVPANPRVVKEDRTVPGPDGAPEVPVRIYRPLDAEGTLPGIYYIHGGGMVLGDIAGEDPTAEMICDEVRAVVVSVEYRLAPENPHPAPLEDCYAALVWMVEHAEELGFDPNRLALYGGSAGGGLVLGTALLARDRGGPPARFMMPIYPAFIDVGTVDLFRDEDIAFAQRLMQAGIPTELHVHDGAYHAAERFAPEAALSLRIWAARLDALRRALA